MPFAWTCPFCSHKTTINQGKHSESVHNFDLDNKYGKKAIVSKVVCCPNEECKEIAISASLHDYEYLDAVGWTCTTLNRTWPLIPIAETKVFPTYVPEAILADYGEACNIRDLSPKSAATLARRCLQGMIMDFWNIPNGNLAKQIATIEDRVDPATWGAIDAVRSIGNIGAHMAADIDLIIDVEPDEAQLLIELIEILINDWYVVREERAKRMKAIVAVADAKKAEKKKPAAEVEPIDPKTE